MEGFHDDGIATGIVQPKLRIAGRPRVGASEEYVLLEEPGEPVLMHYVGRHEPHLKRDCPHCKPDVQQELKSFYYIGGATLGGELVIVELTPKCLDAAVAGAAAFEGGGITGLMVRILRGGYAPSPRILRCVQRVRKFPEWPFHTRAELCRIWNVAIKPRIYREQA